MNTVRKLDIAETASPNLTDKKSTKVNGSEILYLVGKNKGEDKKVTVEYLNEKLAYFYNNGGPIMDI